MFGHTPKGDQNRSTESNEELKKDAPAPNKKLLLTMGTGLWVSKFVPGLAYSSKKAIDTDCEFPNFTETAAVTLSKKRGTYKRDVILSEEDDNTLAHMKRTKVTGKDANGDKVDVGHIFDDAMLLEDMQPESEMKKGMIYVEFKRNEKQQIEQNSISYAFIPANDNGQGKPLRGDFTKAQSLELPWRDINKAIAEADKTKTASLVKLLASGKNPQKAPYLVAAAIKKLRSGESDVPSKLSYYCIYLEDYDFIAAKDLANSKYAEFCEIFEPEELNPAGKAEAVVSAAAAAAPVAPAAASEPPLDYSVLRPFRL